jgi:hypothetical protein
MSLHLALKRVHLGRLAGGFRVPQIDVKALDLLDQQENRLSGRAKIVIAVGIETRAPRAELLDLGLIQTIAQRSP